MRIDDRLTKQNQRINNRNRYNGDDDEETLSYEMRKKLAALNGYKGEFTSKTMGGINTAKSVFDRGAIFRTGEGK